MTRKREQGHKVDCETRVSRYFGYYDRSCPRCEEIYGTASTKRSDIQHCLDQEEKEEP